MTSCHFERETDRETDLIFRDAVVLDGSRERAEVCDIAVTQGHISHILSGEQRPSIKAKEEYLCQGKKALLPGFANAHTHAAMTLLRGLGEETPLKDWLEKHIWPVEERLKPRHIRIGTQLGVIEMARSGITCFGDMYFHMDEVANVAMEAGMRCGLCQGLIGKPPIFSLKLKEGIKLYDRWHGKDDLITVQLGPHAPYTVSVKSLSRAAEAARGLGIGIHTHWLETEWEVGYIKEELKKDPIDLLYETGLTDASHLILAHGVWFPQNRLQEIARDNVTVVHNPSSNLKLGSGFAPVSQMIERGVNVALGSDGAASNNRLDLWLEMRTASLIQKGYYRDPTLIKSKDAIKMATYSGHKALGFSEVGLIKKGWKADFVVVDLDNPRYVGWDCDNLASFIVFSGSSRDICGTMIKGKWIYKDGEFTTMDYEKIQHEARNARDELMAL
ncbi:MAG: amidohydrolase [Acetomicrobium sp.]